MEVELVQGAVRRPGKASHLARARIDSTDAPMRDFRTPSVTMAPDYTAAELNAFL